MSFSNAFKYPFQNLAKVISIVLVLSIAFAVFIGLILNSHDWSPLLDQMHNIDFSDFSEHANEQASEHEFVEFEPMSATPVIGALGLVAVAVVSGFWISGYSVEVVRSIWSDSEVMPGIDFGRNLKYGFYLFLSSAAYGILIMVLLAVELGVIMAAGSLGAIQVLLVFAGLILTVIALATMGWAYLVGMARFAAEDDHRVVFQIKRNIVIARGNWTKGVSLVVYMIGLSIVYGAVRSIVEGVLGGVIGFTGMLGITLSIVIYYVFNLMQHFSTQHLIAQYAVQLGIGGNEVFADKDKVDFD